MRLKNKIVAGLLTVVMIVSGIAVSSVSYDRAKFQNPFSYQYKRIYNNRKSKKIKLPKTLTVVAGKTMKFRVTTKYLTKNYRIQDAKVYSEYIRLKKKNIIKKETITQFANNKKLINKADFTYDCSSKGITSMNNSTIARVFTDGYIYVKAYNIKINLKKQTISTTYLIKGLKPGKYYNMRMGAVYTKKITIVPPKGIHIEPTKGTNLIRLKLGTTRKVFAIDRKKNTGKNLKYKSSNTKVATVSKSGVLKGVGVGKCTLTVSNKKGQKKNITVLVNKFGLFKSDGSEYEYCSFSEDKYKVKDNIKSYVCKYDDYVRNFSNISKNYDGYYYLNIKCPETVYTYDWIYPAFEDVSSTTEKNLDLLNNGGGKVNSKYINVVDSLNKVGTYNVGVEDKYSIKESGISGDTWTYGKIQVLMKDGVIKAGSLNMMNKYFMFEFKSKANSNDKFLVIVNYTTPKMPKFITYKTYHVPDY